MENLCDRNQAIASSLATILQKNFNVKSPQATSLIERCPTFVAKEKSIKSKFLSKNKKVGYHFLADVDDELMPCVFFRYVFSNSLPRVIISLPISISAWHSAITAATCCGVSAPRGTNAQVSRQSAIETPSSAPGGGVSSGLIDTTRRRYES